MASDYVLYHGDCIEVLRTIPDSSIDALVTDPPFAFAGGLSNGMTSQVDSQFFAHWWKDVAAQLERVMKPDGEGFMWCDWRSAHIFASGFAVAQKYSWRLASVIYHYREMPGMGQPFRSSVDMIAYLRGPKSKGARIPNTTHNMISKYWYYGKHKYHPAEKSVDIARQLVEWCSDEGDTILDPFCGSATTGVAALQAKRKYIGMEIDPDHFAVAEQRMGEATQPLLFEVTT